MNRPAPSASIVHVMRMSALLLLTAWGQMMLYSPSLRHSLPTSSRTTRLRLVDMDMARCKRPSSRVKELPSLATDSSCLILVRTSIIRKEKRQSENPSLAIRRRNEADYSLLSNTPSSARVAGTKLPHWQRKLRGFRVVLVSKTSSLHGWTVDGRVPTPLAPLVAGGNFCQMSSCRKSVRTNKSACHQETAVKGVVLTRLLEP